VNCRSIYNKALDFWSLIATYNPNVVIGTESCFSEEISSAEVSWLITQLSEETGTLAEAENLFV
jgi:hypothetical protein